MKSRLIVTAVFASAIVTAGVLAGTTPASNGIAASATGSGQATSGGELRTFAFTAHTDSAGTSTGQAQIDNRSQDRHFHVAIDCLTVIGNRAYASGTVVQSSDPTILGAYGDFAVEDNGQGSKAPPDRITLFNFYGPAFRCDNAAVVGALNGQFFPIDSGNIQVH